MNAAGQKSESGYRAIRIIDPSEGIIVHTIADPLFVQLQAHGIVPIEIELGVERKIGAQLQIAWSTQQPVVKVDVIMFHYLAALVKLVIAAAILLRETTCRKGGRPFHVGDDAIDKIALLLALADIAFLDIFLLGAVLSPIDRRPPQDVYPLFLGGLFDVGIQLIGEACPRGSGECA